MSRDLETRFEYSKKNKRRVSNFVGQELLYEYAIGELDQERSKAVAQVLEVSREMHSDLQKIKHGIDYSNQLSQIQVSEKIVELVNQPNTYLDVLMQKAQIDQWPQGLKWGLEALGVAAVITVISIVVPWDKLININVGRTQTDVILSEVKHGSGAVADTKPEKEQAPLFQDEGKPQSPPSPSGSQPTATAIPVVTPPTSVVAQTKAATTSTANTATPLPKVQTPVAPVPVKPAAPTVQPPTKANIAGKEETNKVHEGFLYRGAIKVTNIDAVTPKMVEALSSLGARKAGEVELGWRKGSGSYFHFTIPESHYEKAVTVFNTYGKLSIQKEKHERVMPDGIVRIIIQVDEAKK